MKPLKQSKPSTGSGKKFTFMRIAQSKAGKLYAEATADISIKKGERFFLNDPRVFLSEEQQSELEENGRIELSTPAGNTYTLYSSLFAEVVKVS